MWKKDEVPAPAPAPQPESSTRPDRRPAADRATIGRSITIRGEVSGDEDLLIQGRVEGSVNLQQHAVTVGPDGVVAASITARIVTIEGFVEGDLSADEQVVLRSSARVQGDIVAPRVVLEDGARFRGGIDMGDVTDQNPKSGGSAPTGSAKSNQSSAGSAGGSTEKGRAEVAQAKA